MEVDLIFKVAAVGILVAVLNILLTRSGREEAALPLPHPQHSAAAATAPNIRLSATTVFIRFQFGTGPATCLSEKSPVSAVPM